MRRTLVLSLLCHTAIVAAQRTDTYSSEVANAYFQLSKPLVTTTPEFSPPAAARAFGYMGIALYEAVVEGMPGEHSLQDHLEHLGPLVQPIKGEAYHWPTAANHALCLMIDSLFFNMTPTLRKQVHALRDRFDARSAPEVAPAVLVRSQAFGRAIAQGVLAMARTDGAHRPQLSNYDPTYVVPIGPEHWIPEGGQSPLLPHWGEKRPFLAEDTTGAALAPPPPPYSTEPGSRCYDDAMEVHQLSTHITVEQQTTVGYWNDGQQTPGTHSVMILEQLLRREGKDLAFAARAYAMLGVGLADAFVSCWKTKYTYTWQRPRNYITQVIDPDWNSWIPTPPFPDHTSGHSAQSGTWATVMTELFGPMHAFTDSTNWKLNGGPRSYPDFWSASQEICMSRLYAGIHFRYSNEDGQAAGAVIGRNVIALFKQLRRPNR